jgi:hypothetical protein
MHNMDYFFRLRRSQEDDTSDHELLRKNTKELEAALTLVRNQKEQELSLLKARAEALEAQLSRDALEAQAKISNLEATIVTNNAQFKASRRNFLQRRFKPRSSQEHQK